METALQSFFISVPQAAALWLLMMGGLVMAALLLARITRPDHTPTMIDEARQAGADAVAAERAATTSERRRAEWAAAHEELDAAWRRFDDAEQAAREAAKAAAFPLMSRRRKPGDNVDRERYLHHAATAACRNREISIAQLNDVYAHRGWNPRLHPVVQEVALRQAVREHRFTEYRKARERERTAWQEAESAAEALREVRREATAVNTRVRAGQPVGGEQWWAEQWTTTDLPAAA